MADAGCAGGDCSAITSGDTALRSARLIVADFMHLEQKSITRRLLICIPIFAVTIGILLYSQRDAAGFDMIWRYFAWCNQTLSVFTLWAITVYLVRMKKNYYVTLLPALFYDSCLFYLYLHCARRIGSFRLYLLCVGRNMYAGCSYRIYNLV